MHLVSALDELQGRLRAILCLHENVATGACDGYGRMMMMTEGMESGPMCLRGAAAALLHLGPGLANGLANLHNVRALERLTEPRLRLLHVLLSQARRARTPALVLVGEMATWHIAADPVLCMDIASLAATVSSSIITFLPSKGGQIEGASILPSNEVKAIKTLPTTAPPHLPDVNSEPNQFGLSQLAGVDKYSRVVTLVIPHDVSRGPSGSVDVEEAVEEVMAGLCGRGEWGSGAMSLTCLDQIDRPEFHRPAATLCHTTTQGHQCAERVIMRFRPEHWISSRSVQLQL